MVSCIIVESQASCFSFQSGLYLHVQGSLVQNIDSITSFHSSLVIRLRDIKTEHSVRDIEFVALIILPILVLSK